MPVIRLTETQGRFVAADLNLRAAGVLKAVRTATQVHGNLLLARVKANAAGRPGPRIVTGSYNRSWNLIMSSLANGVSADVGTNAVQGRRLEFGFVGVDSLGRHYAQPPYPHARPAFDMVAEGYYASLALIVETML